VKTGILVRFIQERYLSGEDTGHGRARAQPDIRPFTVEPFKGHGLSDSMMHASRIISTRMTKSSARQAQRR
jgi:hypothetical protein